MFVEVWEGVGVTVSVGVSVGEAAQRPSPITRKPSNIAIRANRDDGFALSMVATSSLDQLAVIYLDWLELLSIPPFILSIPYLDRSPNGRLPNNRYFTGLFKHDPPVDIQDF